MTKIKNVKIVRIVCKPWMDKKLERIHHQYLLTADSQKMKEFRNTHTGKRCFIIGNGPSLTVSDLDRLKGEYSFAANRIYEIFDQTDWRPWTYIVQDRDFMIAEHEKIRQIACSHRFVPYEANIDTSQWNNTVQIHGGITKFAINRGSDFTACIKNNVAQGFSNGYTVTFIAIQLAIYMGFSEIYLLGVDFNYSAIMDEKGHVQKYSNVKDYFSGQTYESTIQNIEPSRYAYQVAKSYCDEHNIIIRNATRGGKLEVFERVDFDSLFEQGEDTADA